MEYFRVPQNIPDVEIVIQCGIAVVRRGLSCSDRPATLDQGRVGAESLIAKDGTEKGIEKQKKEEKEAIGPKECDCGNNRTMRLS